MVGPEFSKYQVMNGRNRFVPVVVEIVALWSIVHETNRRHIAPLQNKGRYMYICKVTHHEGHHHTWATVA